MLSANGFNLGDLNGVIVDFGEKGDVFGKHNHDEDSVHITIVVRGSIKVFSHDWEKIVRAGQIVDFKPYEPHDFIAMEGDSRIINIVKKCCSCKDF
tara:strand:+ start:1063 stop:1350 length:288 start_codon:yes stop_codon:yes gene_type:complete